VIISRLGLPGNPFGYLFIVIPFVLWGYSGLTYRDELTVDPASREWRLLKGVPPFVKRQCGTLADAKCLRMLRATRSGHDTRFPYTFDVWTAQIEWNDAARPPLPLYALDLKVVLAPREEALRLYEWYAGLIGLPLAYEQAPPG